MSGQRQQASRLEDGSGDLCTMCQQAHNVFGRLGAVEDQGEPGSVELADAIEALRDALVRAWWDGQRSQVRFRVEPVDLTVQVGVTRSGKGTAGVKWHVLALGGERSRETATTQTLRLRLAPVLFDEQGNVLAKTEQLVAGREDDISPAAHDLPLQEPD